MKTTKKTIMEIGCHIRLKKRSSGVVEGDGVGEGEEGKELTPLACDGGLNGVCEGRGYDWELRARVTPQDHSSIMPPGCNPTGHTPRPGCPPSPAKVR
ncbi:hypothetical protein QQP08_003194 [Theobroma cacao]|nr:hypothetical protein QQP08_003194 [Theobroma cacao]